MESREKDMTLTAVEQFQALCDLRDLHGPEELEAMLATMQPMQAKEPVGDPQKSLDVTTMTQLAEKVPDVVVQGDPGAWVCIGKASSQSQGWMKSTKVLPINGLGCLVQVTTQQHGHVAEALAWVPGAILSTRMDGTYYLNALPHP